MSGSALASSKPSAPHVGALGLKGRSIQSGEDDGDNQEGDGEQGVDHYSSNIHDFQFDEDKLEVLKAFFPASLALAPLMKSWERTRMLKKVPFFPDGVIPPALKDDISGLSASLSQAEKKTIKVLSECQERARTKIKLLLYNMYKHMDPEVDLTEQNVLFAENHKIFLMELDDFIFYIKEQQKIILAKHGLESAIGLKDRSIIPPEMKDELKKVVDWKDAVPMPKSRFSGRGGWRGGFRPPRGRRGAHRGRGGFGRGQNTRRDFSRGPSGYGGGYGDGYRSGDSDGARQNSFKSSGRGRGRGSRGAQS